MYNNPIYKFNLCSVGVGDYTSDPDNLPGRVYDEFGNLPYDSRYTTTGARDINENTAVACDSKTDVVFFDSNDDFIELKTGVCVVSPVGTAKYRVKVSNDVFGEFQFYPGVDVRPTYKDELSLEYSLETNQKYYRAKLSGKIAFLADDFYYILNQPFDTEYKIVILKSNDRGLLWEKYWLGKFMQTDCDFDDDDQRLEVQPEVLDEYIDVLSAYDHEYNLIELAPEIKRLRMDKRPLLQTYVPGDSVVGCFLAGSSWEQEVTEKITDKDDLVDIYRFSLCNSLKEIKVETFGTPNVDGLYTGRFVESTISPGEYQATLHSNDGQYYITMLTSGNLMTVDIIRDSDGLTMFEGVATNEDFGTFNLDAFVANGATGYVTCDMATYNVYGRFLCNVEQVGLLPTYQLPIEDIVDDNRNYERVVGYDFDIAYISSQYSDEPTEWGLADNGKYFTPPYSIWGEQFFPLARSQWRNASIWFNLASFSWIFEEAARGQFTLRDTYTVGSCISALLKEIAPDITHEETPEYSQFLYGDLNPITFNEYTLLVSQKSNLLAGEYDRPAQKAPTTLKQFMDMLRDCFRCYWYIEDGKLKIEHVEFFRNGGTYGTNSNYSIDLTSAENVRNGKKYGYKTSKWAFDKVDMPKRYQFNWMDDVTKSFEGWPIEIVSKYVKEDKNEEITIGNFTSDIDYILLNPSEIVQDGFALFAAIKDDNDNFVLPYISRTINGVQYIIQNGYMSFVYLHPNYYIFDLPAKSVKINNELFPLLENVARRKKQTVSFPLIDDPNPLYLCKSYLGDGQVDKLDINLLSRTIKATLKYDTE